MSAAAAQRRGPGATVPAGPGEPASYPPIRPRRTLFGVLLAVWFVLLLGLIALSLMGSTPSR